ncbi:MAG: hypothetical protein NT090_01870 [Acidobacteria bacterium]|nr:hypothetical protein [Acidobacteriota bacterium]
MFLLIDPKKIEDQLAAQPPRYIVAPCNLEPMQIPIPPPTAEIYSMTPLMPPDLQKARERLLFLRERVIEGGQRTLSPTELTQEIDETRGRS